MAFIVLIIYLIASFYYAKIKTINDVKQRLRNAVKMSQIIVMYGNPDKISRNTLRTTISRLRSKLPVIDENLYYQRYGRYLLTPDKDKKNNHRIKIRRVAIKNDSFVKVL